jgi:hypothetical protein
MKRPILFVFLSVILLSCSDVSFKAQSSDRVAEQCEEKNCTPGETYTWFEGTYGSCSKPCGGGEQTRVIECRKNADNAAVPDSFCTGAKPSAVQSCNVQVCSTTYAWNIGTYGDCSKLCGSGTKTRPVVCQSQAGAAAADSQCPQPKPGTQLTCNTEACPPTFTYAWQVTPGACSKQCGGGTATDVVVCRRNDGTTAAENLCTATKPPTTRTCNPEPCPIEYSYTWEAGPWSVCSKTCGSGTQTRSAYCKRNDGVYVPENYCTAAKPTLQQPCNLATCPPNGRAVTQIETVTPALNQVDVVLIIDDSSSMKEDQTKLATRLNGMIADLDASNIDYQMCITSTDVGYYKGTPIKWAGTNSVIMNKATPDKNAVFVNTINSLGAEWSSDEQGIKSTYFMIRDFRASGCFRPQATLATIVISDEDERSTGGIQSLSTIQYKPLDAENYPDNLLSFVRSTFNTNSYTKQFIWNSIIVKPGDTACEMSQDAQTSPSFQGRLYADLSTKTGGFIGSICDTDYTSNLRFIKDRVINNMPGLKMQCTPMNSPTVTFDRAVTTTISIAGDQIKFTPALPEGVKVTVSYTCPN